ncbi:MAG: hypothetical protein IJU04_02275 [Ruminococcus sp.]|nr:hypothetical protein [Ruminococcus sp.]
MPRFQKSLAVAFGVVLTFSIIFSPVDKSQTKQIMLFPGLTFGSAKANDNHKRIKVIDDKNDIEYSCKLYELFNEWFD